MINQERFRCVFYGAKDSHRNFENMLTVDFKEIERRENQNKKVFFSE